MAGEQSTFEKSLDTIINTFHEYSVRHGNPDTLSQKEFKQLAKKELANFLKKENKDKSVIEHIMEDLDTNVDKELSFEEYAILIARLTNASHEELHKGDHGPGHHHGQGLGCNKGQGQGHGHSHGGHGHSH
ncbi:protein S100-A9 [Tamandua tetradactyla]|uniref:protein S100-A9 n=1 Tax=Tamandua tetradactyla TaxID=48850 RepID=UPI00405392C6